MANDRQFIPRFPPSDDSRRDTRSSASILRTGIAAALIVLAGANAMAAKWEVVPTLSVGETYTDNVALAPDATRQSDWVTQVVPGISVAARGQGLRLRANYDPQLMYFANGGADSRVFQRGDAAGTAELADHLLFLDFGGRMDQYDTSLQAPLTGSNVNTTGNRSTVRSYFVSPYLRHDVGTEVALEARFTESIVSATAETPLNGAPATANGLADLTNSKAERVDLHLRSGPAYKLTTWSVEYHKESIDYKNAPDTTSDVVGANVRRLVTSTIGILGQAGYDRYDGGNGTPVSEGFNWGAGLEWVPSPRTRLAATAGHRFYGDAYHLEFDHRTRLTAWAVQYAQSVTATRSQFFVASTTTTTGYLNTLFATQYPDADVREREVNDFVARTGLPPALSGPTNFFSSELFLSKRWQASVGALGVRNVVIADAFKETSSALNGTGTVGGQGDFATSADIIQSGVGLLWDWRITRQVAWNMNVTYNRNEFVDTARTDNATYIGLGIARQLQPKLYGSLNYRRQRNNSSDSQFSFTENAVFATATLRF